MSLWAYAFSFFFLFEYCCECKKWVLILLYDFLGYCDHSQPLQSMLCFYNYLESMWSVWYSFFPFLVLDKCITLESSGGIVYVKLSARFGLVMTKLFYIQRLNSLKCLLRVSKIVCQTCKMACLSSFMWCFIKALCIQPNISQYTYSAHHIHWLYSRCSWKTGSLKRFLLWLIQLSVPCSYIWIQADGKVMTRGHGCPLSFTRIVYRGFTLKEKPNLKVLVFRFL